MAILLYPIWWIVNRDLLIEARVWNRPHPQSTGEIREHSLISTIMSNALNNLLRKRSFSKALFELEEFINAGFAFQCWWRTRFENGAFRKWWRHESLNLPAQVFLKYKSVILEFSNFSWIECMENIRCVFTVKSLFSIFLLYVGLGFSAYVFSYHISHQSRTGCLLFNNSIAIETSKDLWKKLDSNTTVIVLFNLVYLSWGPSFRSMVVYGLWIKPMSF